MKKAKIFVIEDSQDTALHLKIYLEKTFDCELTFVYSGNDAIEVFKKGSEFDVIISDYMMAPGTGLDVLAFINSRGIKTPFILYSGHARELQYCKAGTCKAVIDKIKIEDLIKMVGNLIGQKEKD